MARVSRPPGFDMTYRPTETIYGPPLWARLPAFLYLLLALFVVALVIAGEMSPPTSRLFEYIVTQDVHRPLGARPFAVILMLSALASVVRSGMRGVRIRPEGVECREVIGMLWPRIRRYKWPQIDGIVLDTKDAIALDLWDGTRAFLPAVGDRSGLSAALEKIGAMRAIPVKGGRGLDEVPESADLE